MDTSSNQNNTIQVVNFFVSIIQFLLYGCNLSFKLIMSSVLFCFNSVTINFDKINKYLTENFEIDFDSNILDEINRQNKQTDQPEQSHSNNNISEI